MADTRIFFDPNYEIAVLHNGGPSAITWHVRDEATAEDLALRQGFEVTDDWEQIHAPHSRAGWFSVPLKPQLIAA